MRVELSICTWAKTAAIVVTTALAVTPVGAADWSPTDLAPLRGQIEGPPQRQTMFRALDIPVKQLVELVGAQHGYKVNTSGRVRGSITKTDISGSREDMLRTVATQVPIDWFTHSGILYISSPDEEIVQFLPLKSLTLASVEELLEQSGLDYSRHSVEPLRNEAAIKVVGPPMMVEIIEAIVQLSSASQQQPSNAPSVLVRRGLKQTIEFYGPKAPAPRIVTPEIIDTQDEGSQTDEN